MEREQSDQLGSLHALIIDDEKRIRDTLVGVLSDEGWEATSAASGSEGILKYKKAKPDVVFLDVWMPGIDGIATLQSLKKLDDSVPIVIMSGHGTIETAVKATKIGAYDYLEKPLSLDKILPILNHASKMRSKSGGGFCKATEVLVGRSVEMQSIRDQIERVAPRNAWALITGENGTGKEVVARAIHNHSPRSELPFIAVNCAAIPEELIESELFGHVKGAFTNAIADKPGRFELADKGTLFLDEIGDMSLKTQAKVLRILQEQQFERVGGKEVITVDVRVIAATNKDLKAEIAAGNFREDLYYRLNVVPLKLAPLRERGDDVIELAEHFFATTAKKFSEAPKILSEGARAAMRTYPWPGNVRELMNMVERICIMSPEVEVTEETFRQCVENSDWLEDASPRSRLTLKEARGDFEKAFIEEKLEENEWNISKTAEKIGIERSNLHKKLRLYNIDVKK